MDFVIVLRFSVEFLWAGYKFFVNDKQPTKHCFFSSFKTINVFLVLSLLLSFLPPQERNIRPRSARTIKKWKYSIILTL